MKAQRSLAHSLTLGEGSSVPPAQTLILAGVARTPISDLPASRPRPLLSDAQRGGNEGSGRPHGLHRPASPCAHVSPSLQRLLLGHTDHGTFSAFYRDLI